MEIRTVGDIRQFVHSKLLALRNFYTTVASEKFVDAYEKATSEQKKEIWELVKKEDKILLSKFIRKLLRDSLETLNIRELRSLAQEYGVQNYQILPKASLLSALAMKERTNESSNCSSQQNGEVTFKM